MKVGFESFPSHPPHHWLLQQLEIPVSFSSLLLSPVSSGARDEVFGTRMTSSFLVLSCLLAILLVELELISHW